LWLFVFAVSLIAPRPSFSSQDVPQPSAFDGYALDIVNGVPTADYPTVGALGVLDDHGNLQRLCSGTLIGCRTFLTAAHCVCPSSATDAASCLAAGLNSNMAIFLQHAGIFQVASAVIHPTYKRSTTGDIAVVNLTSRETGVAPTRINSVGSPPAGTRASIVGFGITDNLLKSGSGVKRVGDVTTAPCPTGSQSPTLVCWNFTEPLGPPGTNSGTCHGDSGGPLFVDLGAGATVAGIDSSLVSDADSCLPPAVTFETDVFAYGPWIRAQAGADLDATFCGDIPQVGSTGTEVLYAGDILNASSSAHLYSFAVASGTTELRVAMNGETSSLNNFGLFIKAGSPPTPTDYDCFAGASGGARTSFDFCEVDQPASGTWYVVAALGGGLGGQYQLTATTFAGVPTTTPGRTFTRTATATGTVKATSTQTATKTGTATRTPPPSQTRTLTATATPTTTSTRTTTATFTFTRTATATPTVKATLVPTQTPTLTGTTTRSPSPSQTHTLTVTATPTTTTTRTATVTLTFTRTATSTLTPTRTIAICAAGCVAGNGTTENALRQGAELLFDSPPVVQCPHFDGNGDGAITVADLVAMIDTCFGAAPTGSPADPPHQAQPKSVPLPDTSGRSNANIRGDGSFNANPDRGSNSAANGN
jgi:hypothetical protein